MYALSILSFDSNLSKNDEKAAWLIEMHRMLFQAYKDQFKADKANSDQKSDVALYFETVKRLPEEMKKDLFGEMSLPRVNAFGLYRPYTYLKKISELLRRKFSVNESDFIVVTLESGLESEILPMNITIKDGTGKRIIGFIEIDGPSHFITVEDGQEVLKRRNQLKEELYKFNHPGMPLMRIDLSDKRRYEEYADELYEKVTIYELFHSFTD
jgi:hypothetical protein